MIKDGVQGLDVTVLRIFEETVLDPVPTLFDRIVVVNAKDVEIISFDNPGNLRLCPRCNLWIGKIELSPVGNWGRRFVSGSNPGVPFATEPLHLRFQSQPKARKAFPSFLHTPVSGQRHWAATDQHANLQHC